MKKFVIEIDSSFRWWSMLYMFQNFFSFQKKFFIFRWWWLMYMFQNIFSFQKKFFIFRWWWLLYMFQNIFSFQKKFLNFWWWWLMYMFQNFFSFCFWNLFFWGRVKNKKSFKFFRYIDSCICSKNKIVFKKVLNFRWWWMLCISKKFFSFYFSKCSKIN